MFVSLVDSLAARSTPLLTFYGSDERIDLSGPVVARWCHKVAGFLLTDVGVDEDAALLIALPTHWRAVMWATGALEAGCRVTLREPAAVSAADLERADLVVSNSADVLRRAAAAGVFDLFAQVLDSLQLAWPGEPPAGADDAAPAVQSQPDSLDAAAPQWDPAARPLAGCPLTVADLLSPEPARTPTPVAAHPQPPSSPAAAERSQASATAALGRGRASADPATQAPVAATPASAQGAPLAPASERSLLVGPTPLQASVAALRAWASGGSLVLVDARLAGDVAHIAAQERATPVAP